MTCDLLAQHQALITILRYAPALAIGPPTIVATPAGTIHSHTITPKGL